MSGWIKLHRSFINWEWYADINVRVLFMHLLITVNYEDKKWRGRIIKKGSRITGRKQLSDETGLSEMNIRTAIKKLKSTNDLTISKDVNGSMFTVVNWQKHQEINQDTNQEINQALTKHQPSTNQALTTTKEVKKEKKEKKRINDLVEIGFEISKEFNEAWYEWMKVRASKKASESDNAIKRALNKLLKLSNGNQQKAISILLQSCDSGWSDLYQLKENQKQIINNPKNENIIKWRDNVGNSGELIESEYLKMKLQYEPAGYKFTKLN